MNTNQRFSTHRYLFQTIDPVHIGTGGMRLGRVDNSIVREPGTRLPKIPGTSLSGAARHYAAYRYGKRRCAGQKGHCGNPTCPICYTFGSISGDSGQGGGQKNFAGVVSIGDARVLLFPVYSMAGPVWVTSPSALEGFGITGQEINEDKARMAPGLNRYPHLNLGWLMMEMEEEKVLSLDGLPDQLPDPVGKRMVIISDKVFSQVVNSNLEIRTSVSIDPETGAAEEGALFTYEAIPRATFMWMDMVEDDYREAFPGYHELETWEQLILSDSETDVRDVKDLLQQTGLLSMYNDSAGNTSKDQEKFEKAKEGLLRKIDEEKRCYDAATTLPGHKRWNKDAGTDLHDKDTPAHVVTAGLEWSEHLGIGGMGTRGFGRIRMVDHEVK